MHPIRQQAAALRALCFGLRPYKLSCWTWCKGRAAFGAVHDKVSWRKRQTLLRLQSSQQHSQVSQPHRLDAIHMAIVCSSILESLPVPIVAAPAPAPAPASASASASLFILQAEAAICAASPFCMCCGECPVQLLTRPSQQEAACEPSSSAAHRQQFCPSKFPGALQTVAHISHQVCCEGLPLHCPCMVVPVHCRLQLQRKQAELTC